MRISDWSSDVCSSDLPRRAARHGPGARRLQECERFPRPRQLHLRLIDADARRAQSPGLRQGGAAARWIYNGKCRDAVIVPVVTQIARLTDRVAKPVCIEGADEIVWSRSGQGCGTSAVPTRCVMPKQKGRLQRNRPFSISLLVEPRGIEPLTSTMPL